MGNLNTLIKPITRLTKEQWKTIVMRTMAREDKVGGSGLLRAMTDELHEGNIQPDAIKKVGELGVPTPGGNIKTVRLPIEEARARYFANPDDYIAGGYAPQVSQVTTSPAQPPMGVPEDMVFGGLRDIAVERVKQVPIVPPRLTNTRRSIEKGYMLKEAEDRLAQKGIGLNDVDPNVNPARALEEQGVKLKKDEVLPPVGQLTQSALIADQLWKDMGGGRSSGARVWELYRKSSRQSSHIANGRDYFISSFIRWKENPGKFVKSYPREAKLLNQLWTEFEASLAGGK